MWSAVIVFVMAALSGFYMMPAERSRIAVENLAAREQAESMGIYREAVVAYFAAHDVTGTSVSFSALKSAHVLPEWSPLSASSANVPWSNYRDSAGVIYIFAATPGTRNIVSEVMTLSHNSLNVGIYRAADRSLYAPADGTRVDLASLGAGVIPDAALVWMAARP